MERAFTLHLDFHFEKLKKAYGKYNQEEINCEQSK